MNSRNLFLVFFTTLATNLILVNSLATSRKINELPYLSRIKTKKFGFRDTGSYATNRGRYWPSKRFDFAGGMKSLQTVSNRNYRKDSNQGLRFNKGFRKPPTDFV